MFSRENRGVAQLASALAWGARGRVFESHHSDTRKGLYELQALFCYRLPNDHVAVNIN